jgi:hypothetical protein
MLLWRVLGVGTAVAAASCTQPIIATLMPGPATGVVDQSVTAPTRHGVRVVMVLPPEGTESNQQKVPEISSLEKELLRRGIRVISAGLTGRVAIESRVTSESGQAAAHMSQLERALVLAKKSNADALLQVEVLGWAPESRRFVYRPPATSFDKATQADWDHTPNNQHYSIVGPTLHLAGKLIDVESGEVMEEIDLAQATVNLVDRENAKEFTWMGPEQGFMPVDYGDGTMSTESPEFRQRAEDKLMGILATHIAGSHDDPPPSPPTPPPPPPPLSVAPPPPPPPEPPAPPAAPKSATSTGPSKR